MEHYCGDGTRPGHGRRARKGRQGTHREAAALRRGSSGSGRVRGGAGQGSVVRGLAGKTGHAQGEKAFGTMTKNEASPLCLNKSLKGSRRATRQFRYNCEICIQHANRKKKLFI